MVEVRRIMYPTIDAYNLSQGMGQLFVYSEAVVPFFDALVFGALLLIITFGIYFTQEIKKGRGDFPVAFAVGNTVTVILAGIIQTIQGFLQPYTLGILIGLNFISYIWLYYSYP